jgi:hypothetical protein
MSKALLLFKDHPDLKETALQIVSVKSKVHEKIAEIQKQADAIAEEASKENRELFTKIEDRLVSLGLLPEDFKNNRDEYRLYFEDEAEVLFMEKREQEEGKEGEKSKIIQALKKLFDSL